MDTALISIFVALIAAIPGIYATYASRAARRKTAEQVTKEAFESAAEFWRGQIADMTAAMVKMRQELDSRATDNAALRAQVQALRDILFSMRGALTQAGITFPPIPPELLR